MEGLNQSIAEHFKRASGEVLIEPLDEELVLVVSTDVEERTSLPGETIFGVNVTPTDKKNSARSLQSSLQEVTTGARVCNQRNNDNDRSRLAKMSSFEMHSMKKKQQTGARACIQQKKQQLTIFPFNTGRVNFFGFVAALQC